MRVIRTWVLAAAVVAPSCAQQRLAPSWPGDTWPASAPEEQGMDSAALNALDSEFASGRHGYIDGMLIVRHGSVVFDRTYDHDYVKLFAGKDQARGPYNYYDPDWHPWYRKSDLVAVFNGWNIYDRPELDPKFALDRVLAAIRFIGQAGSL